MSKQPLQPGTPRRDVTCTCGSRLRIGARQTAYICPRCNTRNEVPEAQPDPNLRMEFRCDCGVRLGAPAHTDAPSIRCPKCKTKYPMPRIELEYMYDEEDTGEAYELTRTPVAVEEKKPVDTGPPKICPSCEQSLPSSARLCVDCGIDLKTGRAILTRDDAAVDRAYEVAEPVIWIVSWLAFFGVYPVASEAFGLRTPWAVRGIAVLTVCITIWFWFATAGPNADPALLSLMAWSAVPPELAGEVVINNAQLFTHQLLHADLFHLLGNLLFLMVLGSRVNALIGNVLTVICYPLLGVLAALIELESIGSEPASLLGASGAIAGLSGMYLVFFPTHTVHLAWWLRFPIWQLNTNISETRGYVVVVFFMLFDLLYIMLGSDTGVAHWAHLGGFLGGVGLAILLLAFRLVNARGGDLLSVLLGRWAWGIIGRPNRPGLTLW